MDTSETSTYEIRDVFHCKLFNFLLFFFITPGPRLNKKDGLTRYGDSHVKDKTS